MKIKKLLLAMLTCMLPAFCVANYPVDTSIAAVFSKDQMSKMISVEIPHEYLKGKDGKSWYVECSIGYYGVEDAKVNLQIFGSNYLWADGATVPGKYYFELHKNKLPCDKKYKFYIGKNARSGLQTRISFFIKPEELPSPYHTLLVTCVHHE